MNRSRLHRHFLALAAAGMSLSLALSTEPAAHPSSAAPNAPPAATDESEKAKDAQNNKTIEKIIEESENVLAGRGFTYDPAGRRDPFRSLVEQTKAEKGPRPKGIAGMLISEVDLVGIVQKGKDCLAFFNGSDNKGYFLRVGDQLYDGRIILINRSTGQVVFRQEINDPRSIKPYRDITKRLYTAEEEKS
jgi:Tfp pilus assembly protein PilP